jgi:hypothetical protein
LYIALASGQRGWITPLGRNELAHLPEKLSGIEWSPCCPIKNRLPGLWITFFRVQTVSIHEGAEQEAGEKLHRQHLLLRILG